MSNELKAFEAAVAVKQEQAQEQEKSAVSPPGWEDTVKRMKKHEEIDNPWALAWSMKNKGYKPHPKKEASTVRVFEDAVLARKVAARFAKVFPSEKAMQDYLFDHPSADQSKHRVRTDKDKKTQAEGKAKAKSDFDKSDAAKEVKKLQQEKKDLQKKLRGPKDIEDPKHEKRIKDIDKKLKELQKGKKGPSIPMEPKDDRSPAEQLKALKTERRKLRKDLKKYKRPTWESRLKEVEKKIKSLEGK